MDIQQKVDDLRRRLAKVEAEVKPPAAESRLDELRRRLAEIETELADMEPSWADDDERMMCFGCGKYVEEKHVCYS